MGSKCRCQTFSSATPHFFSVILDDASRDIKVEIPKKFVMKSGQGLSNSACLQLPSGEKWQVELTRCNGKVWLEKGWSEFSKFLSLDYGDFLVFRYEGNSVFQVCICDRTATEIEYPSKKAPAMEKKGHEEGDISIVILEDSPPHPKKRAESPLTRSRSDKKLQTIRSLKEEYMRLQNGVGGSSTKQKCLKRTVEDLGEFRKLNDDEKARALSCTEGFTSKEAHFKIVMQPSYIHLDRMRIPLNFLSENQIKKNKYAIVVTLRMSTGKTWSVKFTYHMSNAKFGHGWFAFVKDNCLKVGDVCVFILLKDTNLSFQVEIFRARGFTVMQVSQVAADGRGRALHVQDSIRSIKAESDCGIAGKNKGSGTANKLFRKKSLG